MKAFKKSNTYGEEENWQICRKDREVVEKELRKYSVFSVQDELIDDMIVVLHKLGYVRFEDE